MNTNRLIVNLMLIGVLTVSPVPSSMGQEIYNWSNGNGGWFQVGQNWQDGTGPGSEDIAGFELFLGPDPVEVGFLDTAEVEELYVPINDITFWPADPGASEVAFRMARAEVGHSGSLRLSGSSSQVFRLDTNRLDSFGNMEVVNNAYLDAVNAEIHGTLLFENSEGFFNGELGLESGSSVEISENSSIESYGTNVFGGLTISSGSSFRNYSTFQVRQPDPVSLGAQNLPARGALKPAIERMLCGFFQALYVLEESAWPINYQWQKSNLSRHYTLRGIRTVRSQNFWAFTVRRSTVMSIG